MIDLNPTHLATVKAILAKHVPGCEVRAFGSRVTWTAKDYSDLDLAIVCEKPLDLATLGELREAFEESDLPMRVDVLDWHSTAESFRKVINKKFLVLQALSAKAGGGWPTVSVADIAAPTANSLATGPFGSAIAAKFFRTTGVPVIRGSNLGLAVEERLVERDLVFVDPGKAHEFSRSMVRRGDLVFTCWGTVGQVGLIDERARYPEYIISNKQMKLTPDPKKADSLFLYYCFRSPRVVASIVDQAIGSSVPGFNLGQLRAIQLSLPPLAQQRAIARILGALDDRIELNRRMNETLEAMARALFKSWFIDFDPVRAKMVSGGEITNNADLASIFPDSITESGMPRGWTVAPLTSLVDVNPTRTLTKGQLATYLDMGNMPVDGHHARQWERRAFGSGARFRNGDTLVARITPCLENGKTAFVDFLIDDEVGWGSTEYIVLRPRPPLPEVYAYYLARTESFRSFAIQNMSGTSGRQRVPTACLAQFLVVCPSPGVAQAFGAQVDRWTQAIRANAQESRELAQLRDVVLPRLLSGELGIPDAERAIEQVA